jgi:hypothetical protein
MALFVNFHGQSIFELGSYSFTSVAQGAPQEAQLGIVALIGEANEGPAFAAEAEGISATVFNPGQFTAIVNKFGSGQLVDAARLALNPSNDPDIQGGAQQLVLLKTNQSAKASLTLASSYGTLKAKREGTPGNQTNATITQATATKTILTTTGNTTIGSPSLTNLASTTGIQAGQTVTGTGIPASTTVLSISGTTVTLSQNASANGSGVSVTFTKSYAQDTITLNRADLGLTEISSPIGGNGVLTLQCTDGSASAATTTVSATALTTSITGGTTSPLNILLTQFNTLTDLVAYINTISGYSASLANTAQGQSPLSILDRVTTQDIKSSSYTINRDAADVQDFFATSQLADFTPGSSGYVGVPSALAKTYFSGGTLGATSQANIQTCIDALASINTNFMVPLFSRDATADIAAGITDSASSYVIASIHAATRTHVNQQSTIKGRHERQAWCGYLDNSFSNVQNAAATLAAGRVSLCFQQVNIQDASGNTTLGLPHMLGVIAAGMKAAAPVGLGNEWKLCNITGYKTTNSSNAAYFNPVTDAVTAIQSNLTYVEKAEGGGFQFGIDNSTYGQSKDAWYWSRPSVVYASDIAAKTIRLNMASFIGKRNSDVTATTITKPPYQCARWT